MSKSETSIVCALKNQTKAVGPFWCSHCEFYDSYWSCVLGRLTVTDILKSQTTQMIVVFYTISVPIIAIFQHVHFFLL